MGEDHDGQGLVRLDEQQCWEFVARHSLGRVGLVHLSNPLIFPVNYALDGGTVVFRTAPGTKLATAGLGRPAVFEVDEASPLFETGTSVMVHGTLHRVTEHAERERLAHLPLRPWAPGTRDQLVRLEPGWVTGRRIPVHPLDDTDVADGG